MAKKVPRQDPRFRTAFGVGDVDPNASALAPPKPQAPAQEQTSEFNPEAQIQSFQTELAAFTQDFESQLVAANQSHLSEVQKLRDELAIDNRRELQQASFVAQRGQTTSPQSRLAGFSGPALLGNIPQGKSLLGA